MAPVFISLAASEITRSIEQHRGSVLPLALHREPMQLPLSIAQIYPRMEAPLPVEYKYNAVNIWRDIHHQFYPLAADLELEGEARNVATGVFQT